MGFSRAADFSKRCSSEPTGGGSGSDDDLELIAVERTFGTEELSAYSACLTDLEEGPGIFICQTDAEKLNLIEGDRVSLELDGGKLEANLRIADNMAAGTLVISRHKDLDWQKMGTGRTLVRIDQIRKVA